MTIWIKFTDKPPPDDDTEIYIRKINNEEDPIMTPANEIWFDVSEDEMSIWEWCLARTYR